MTASNTGKRARSLLAGAALLLVAASASMESPAAQRGPRGWPPITAETKPWTRWWWQGSAVDRPSLTAQLEALAAAGIGGVEVTPIYGVRGAEDRFIPYLSPQWMAMLDHTLREATRLKMGVDMATGTGWPFGGPVGRRRHGGEVDRLQDLDARRRTNVSPSPSGSGRRRSSAPSATRFTSSTKARPETRHAAPRHRRRSSGPTRGPFRSADLVEPVSGQPQSAGTRARAGEVPARSAAHAC